ncbi:peptidylprolyl isomerase [uncultured Maritalea sp.]|uniref:peptidylprolyl isomerase n=1 Tax=uncultured Maritalea sp. TaxID=757249 RepID=UPI0026142A9E|nr:peptidylprolyl isomerase [uncultured Maritalea sp.]
MLKNDLKRQNGFRKFLLGGAVAFGMLSAPAVFAQEILGPDVVIAVVGGENITQAELSYALEDMGEEITQIPVNERRDFLVQMLVDMKVMAQAARKAGMADTTTFASRKTYLEDRALRRAYLQDVMATEVSQDELKAAYDDAFKNFEGKDMFRARHILLASEDDAKLVVVELDNGRDFAEVAKEKSTGPSGPQGGDLGYFSEGDMVPEFFEATRALEVGAHSGPVQSQFGWHVIKLEDRRPSTPPTFEQVLPQIRQRVMVGKFEKLVEDLKAGSNIQIMNVGN